MTARTVISGVTPLGSDGVGGALALDPSLIDRIQQADFTEADLEREQRILGTVKPSILDPGRIFTPYIITAQARNKIMGGIPRNPKVIEAWIRKQMGVTNTEELRRETLKTLQEQGASLTGEETLEELFKASEKLADTKSTNGFKFDDNGLYIETRQLKAMLKEAVNILYAGVRWGDTSKGPKNFLAERVFVRGDKVYLMRDGQHIKDFDGVDMVIGHVSGPQGPRSTLTYHQFVLGCDFQFEVMSQGNCIAIDQPEKSEDDKGKKKQTQWGSWAEILTLCQEGGVGALRSQGHGRFNVVEMVEVVTKKKSPFTVRKVEVED